MGVAEKEKVLKDVANIRNTRDEEGRLYPATSYLKPDDVEVRTEELNFLEKQLNVGPWVGMTDEGRANLNKRKAVLTRELRHGVPPEIDGATKDALGKKLKHLEKQIADGMPTHEAMRRNPAGAVDHHMKWDRWLHLWLLHSCHRYQRRQTLYLLQLQRSLQPQGRGCPGSPP